MNSNTPVSEVLRLIRGTAGIPESNQWRGWDNVQEAHHELLEEYIRQQIEPPESRRGQGRGIVICAGGENYFPSLWVLVHNLRQHGCSLPIEVWYHGYGEMDPAMRRLLAPLGVTFINLAAVSALLPCRGLHGWTLKPYASLNSRFQEVIYLDADVMLRLDPEQLLRTPEYGLHGAIFFPDFPTWNTPESAWQAVRMGPPIGHMLPVAPADGDVWHGQPIPEGAAVALETGCFVIDKGRHWLALELSLFLCQHSDFYFHFLHGDCGTLEAAWLKLGHTYARPNKFPDWDEHSIIQFDLEGQPFLEHRSMDKWRLDGRNRHSRQQKLTQEAAGFEAISRLTMTWPGAPWHNYRPLLAEQRMAAALAGTCFTYQRVGYDERVLELLPGGEIGEGGADKERRWELYLSEDQVQLAFLDSAGGLTCLLSRHLDGAWYGHWQQYERMSVVLTPVKGLVEDGHETVLPLPYMLPGTAMSRLPAPSGDLLFELPVDFHEASGDKLNLGCGLEVLEGYVGVDCRAYGPHVAYVLDLDCMPWPWADHSVSVVRAVDVVEHLADVVGFMDECWRILQPGGWAYIRVPYCFHFTTWTDPTHRRGFTPQSFEYFTDSGYGEKYPYTTRKWTMQNLSARPDRDGNLHFLLRPIQP